MRTRTIFIRAVAAAALAFALAGCGLEQSPTSTARDTADDGLVAAVDSERMVISFSSTAPAPAGKTRGADAKAQREADRLAAQAQREADRLAAQADRQAAKADRQAAQALDKQAKQAQRAADRLTAEADRLAAQAQRQADRLAAQANGNGAAATEAGDPLTVSGWIGPDGGKLEISSEGDKRGSSDDLKVKFIVPEGSLAEPVEIVMSVKGRFLSELEIGFGPSGTTFDPPAKLQVHLGMDLLDTDPFSVTAKHRSGDNDDDDDDDGDDVEVELSGTSVRNYILELDVVGFSRYTLGD